MNQGAFFDVVRHSMFGGSLSQEQVYNIKILLATCERAKLQSPLNATAYILATVYHETDRKMEPIEEYGGTHKRYAPWYGRGHVQLTWEANYLEQQEKLEQDPYVKTHHLPYRVHEDRNNALHPEVSAMICVFGMRDGDFTGAKLSWYVNPWKVDFENARRVVNGKDRAELIEGYAWDFRFALKEAGYVEPVQAYAAGRAIIGQSINAHHPDVLIAQERLAEKGHYHGDLDGVAGPLFDNAVRAYQRRQGLWIDGVIGPVTWAALVPQEVVT